MMQVMAMILSEPRYALGKIQYFKISICFKRLGKDPGNFIKSEAIVININGSKRGVFFNGKSNSHHSISIYVVTRKIDRDQRCVFFKEHKP